MTSLSLCDLAKDVSDRAETLCREAVARNAPKKIQKALEKLMLDADSVWGELGFVEREKASIITSKDVKTKGKEKVKTSNPTSPETKEPLFAEWFPEGVDVDDVTDADIKKFYRKIECGLFESYGSYQHIDNRYEIYFNLDSGRTIRLNRDKAPATKLQNKNWYYFPISEMGGRYGGFVKVGLCGTNTVRVANILKVMFGKRWREVKPKWGPDA